ncbi:hypothetical protein [Aquimarina spongiae]|uniref:Lipoprotein n=1 Tax=Aquimarina spongiae TaxID=570521 RepID=A0A1M6A7X7_9FLAO|nr:hypothetical protein [Aquimarina spongiae]SHI32582.1 hypothetical protein SAMN04488508_101147 [Aquimarina spongiae]
MKNPTTSYVSIAYSMLILLLFSCSSDNTVDEGPEEEPVPIQEFFFQGTLGEEEFNMKSELYASGVIPPIDDYTFDFGGFGIQKRPRNINGEEVEFCSGSYAFGLFPVIGSDANIVSAKLFIRNIDLDQCSIENERLGLEDAFANQDFTFAEAVGDDRFNQVTFFFFLPDVPGVPENEQDFYRSNEENSNSTFKITNVTREEPNSFAIEGIFSCRMYSHLDETKFKDITDGKFKVRILTNLDRDVNF